ncbi:MAG TPA: SAM-dependent methyltransferase [Rhodocyclaceae bacterium]|jgi:SAM-dependent MidA family methyltransferase|nr:SAM-dependent methyltransferase [Rhodocyclaceae bacterium]
MNTELPQPSADAAAASQALHTHIAAEIAAAGGWISFARYMELALYTPGLGYYSGGARKFGAAGDFVTAPELTPLFARTLAAQAAQVMTLSAPHIVEAGGGSGALAADLLLALETRNALPETYSILELSGDLRARQKETLQQRAPHLLSRVTWLDTLPEKFSGFVVGNEVLDAMPVHLIHWAEADTTERGVMLDANGQFAWQDKPLPPALQPYVEALPVTAPYLSELNLAAQAWIAAWADILERGALVLSDYGFPRHEYYHAQRNQGTLMCHYRHHAHGDPFWLPGLNDITAHVDFTAIAEAGFEAGLNVAGYLSQAAFLINCGITDVLAQMPPEGAEYFRQARAVEKLLNPAEMGELFKVIALSKDIDVPLIGFIRGDKTHTL